MHVPTASWYLGGRDKKIAELEASLVYSLLPAGSAGSPSTGPPSSVYGCSPWGSLKLPEPSKLYSGPRPGNLQSCFCFMSLPRDGVFQFPRQGLHSPGPVAPAASQPWLTTSQPTLRCFTGGMNINASRSGFIDLSLSSKCGPAPSLGWRGAKQLLDILRLEGSAQTEASYMQVQQHTVLDIHT